MPATSFTGSSDANNVLLGLGTLGLASYPSGSPAAFQTVGFIKSCQVTYSREFKDFESAGLLVKRLVFRDRLVMHSDWAEIKITNLNKLMRGTTAGNDTAGSIAFGGDRSIQRYVVRFEHTTSDGRYVTLDIYKSTPAGEARINFAEEEFITYPVEFQAEVDSARAAGQQYARINIAA